jgi:hypothetical protein
MRLDKNVIVCGDLRLIDHVTTCYCCYAQMADTIDSHIRHLVAKTQQDRQRALKKGCVTCSYIASTASVVFGASVLQYLQVTAQP